MEAVQYRLTCRTFLERAQNSPRSSSAGSVPGGNHRDIVGDGHIYTPDFITEHYVIEIKGRLYPGNFVVEKAEAALDTLEERDYVLVATDRVAEQVPHDIHISWENREKLIDLLKDD